MKKLKNLQIKWIVPKSVSSLVTYIPYRNSVVVSDAEGIQEIQDYSLNEDFLRYYTFINYETFPNFDSLLINIIRELWDIKEYTTLLCAIDPGQKNTGIAYFLDRNLLTTEIVHENINVIERINLYIFSLKPDLIEIKLGTGNLQSLRELIRLILGYNKGVKIIKNADIYLINEFGTSKKNTYYYKNTFYGKNISKDEKAAILIGIRSGNVLKGEDIKKIFNKKIHNSELKYFQNESRRKTNGELSLSRNLARKVVIGKLSLEQAIIIQKKNKKS
ncbi:MAG: hypothetical protein ACTSWY_06880 [Promethearchaeota archaeon]